MSGWSGTGYRRWLGETIVTEYRTVAIAFVWLRQSRTVTTERAEWVGLTLAGAQAKAATGGWTITQRDRIGPSGQYRVVEEKVTEGAWS